MTKLPWFRETFRESKKQLRMAYLSFRHKKTWSSWEDILDWRDALFRAQRILQKRKDKHYCDKEKSVNLRKLDIKNL